MWVESGRCAKLLGGGPAPAHGSGLSVNWPNPNPCDSPRFLPSPSGWLDNHLTEIDIHSNREINSLLGYWHCLLGKMKEHNCRHKYEHNDSPPIKSCSLLESPRVPAFKGFYRERERKQHWTALAIILRGDIGQSDALYRSWLANKTTGYYDTQIVFWAGKPTLIPFLTR